jgi:phenylacetate-CoA ligase
MNSISTIWNLYRGPRRDRADLVRFRDRKLRHLVRFAYERVSFYRDWFDAVGVRPEHIRRAKDLAKLPLLSKPDLRNAPVEAVLARGRNPAKLVTHKTSGSTGEPFTIYRTRTEEDLLQLFRLRAARQYGFRLFDRRADLTTPLGGGPPDPLRGAARLLRLMPIESLDSTRDVAELLLEVHRIRPDVLTGYPGVLSQISRQLPNFAELRIRPRFVVAGGEPMTDRMRRRIERGFAAPVYDMYGSNEFNLLAWQCPANGHMHICEDSVVLEILRDGIAVKEGEQGEVVVTGLLSKTMPFIRYRTGDLAVKGAEVCGCGQPFSTLDAIQGRTADYLRLPDGRLVHPFAMTAPLYEESHAWIDQHQLAQTALDRIVLRLKVRRPATPDELGRLIAAGESVCRPARFEVEFVDRIEPHPSGKFRSYVGLEEGSA